jgi:hypothetical protein
MCAVPAGAQESCGSRQKKLAPQIVGPARISSFEQTTPAELFLRQLPSEIRPRLCALCVSVPSVLNPRSPLHFPSQLLHRKRRDRLSCALSTLAQNASATWAESALPFSKGLKHDWNQHLQKKSPRRRERKRFLRRAAAFSAALCIINVVITSEAPFPTRAAGARVGMGARDLLLASCSQVSPQRHSSANSCAQMFV